MRTVEQWEDEANARQYDDFARRYQMYRLLSSDLVRRAGIGPGDRVLDLACGTGITTESILEALGPAGRVVGVDASAAMLDLARHHVRDERVEWVNTPAETLRPDVGGPFDVVVCNSAIWQVEMPEVIAHVAALLAPGGRFAGNLGTNKLPDGTSAPQPENSKPSLHQLMRAIATLDYDVVFGPPTVAPQSAYEERLTAALADHGLAVEPAEYAAYPFDAEQTYAWCTVPIFARQVRALTYAQHLEVLDKAYARLDPSAQAPSRWVIISATAR